MNERSAQDSALPDRQHPDRGVLVRFLRGEASQPERRAIVRHLLAGCPECVAVTRPVWRLADRPLPDLDELEAPARRPRRSRVGRRASLRVEG